VTDDVTLKPIADLIAIPDAVVTACAGAVGAHVGILYLANDDGVRDHLHLAWHYDLRNDRGQPSEGSWIVPRLRELELADVRASARLIAKRNADGRVPYALDRSTARFDATGALELNGSKGLTCATFLLLVFAHAQITLLDVGTWDRDRAEVRRREDDEAQAKLVAYLHSNPKSRAQAELIEREVGCTRIRAEEVAAASGMDGHPVEYLRAEPEGRRVLAEVLAPAE
jgi:hypothetical protein